MSPKRTLLPTERPDRPVLQLLNFSLMVEAQLRELPLPRVLPGIQLLQGESRAQGGGERGSEAGGPGAPHDEGAAQGAAGVQDLH